MFDIEINISFLCLGKVKKIYFHKLFLYYYVYEIETKFVIIINIIKFTRITTLYSFNEKKWITKIGRPYYVSLCLFLNNIARIINYYYTTESNK